MNRQRAGIPFPFVLASMFLLALSALPASASVGPCTSDIDASGTVDLSDLLLCQGGDPRCDINGDSAVDCFDIQYVLGNFGSDCTCEGDVDGDGDVDLDDLLLVQGRYGTNDCRVDVDQNGFVEANDVDTFLCVYGTSEPRGDFNGDGVIDYSDLAILLTAVTTPPRDCRADVDGDGSIDLSDLSIVLAQFGGSCP